MPVAVYKLRIRDTPGDDTAWQEARVVAASVAEALVQAQQRFGEERVMAIAQDSVGEDPTDEEAASYTADAAPHLASDGVPVVYADAIVARPPDDAADAPTRAEAIANAAFDHEPVADAAPMPWEGRWRPSVLVWIGIAAGVVLFLFWFQVGTSGRERFVTVSPEAAASDTALPLDGEAPPGGVLAATGVRVRPRADDADAMQAAVGEAVANWPEESGVDQETAEQVRTIGTAVGDLFARWPAHEVPPPDAPPYRIAQPDPAPLPPPPPGTVSSYPLSPPPGAESAPIAQEGSVQRPFFVEVERGGRIETLRVSAYDADHARAIVSNLSERPIIRRGPSPQLDW